MSTFQLTEEQLAVIDHVCTSPSSLQVRALAGAAKTTTIEHAIRQRGGVGVLAIAFNKKIATALAEKLPMEAVCMTLNAMGHRAWGSYIKNKLYLDTSKTYHILNGVMNAEHVHEEEFLEVAANLRGLVTAAKVAGLVPTGCKGEQFSRCFFADTEENWERLGETYDCDVNADYIRMAREALRIGISQAFAGTIDFNDQIYMSTCWEAPFAQFPLVVVDEAQDLSQLNHHMIAKCIARGGKLVAIGDPYQSIYAFRGADTSSMDLLQARFKMETLELNTTFRCSKAVAEHVRPYVPHIRSPGWARKGAVRYHEALDLAAIPVGSAIICRNNKPLMQMAYKFIKAGRPVVLNGGDFGEQLIKLLRKVAGATSKSEAQNDRLLKAMDTAALLKAVKVWEEKEIAIAQAKNKAYRVSGIEDKAGSLRVVIQSCKGRNAADILAELRQLFENKVGSVILSSGHKSKGLEWEQVYHLNAHLCPSKYSIRALEEAEMMIEDWEVAGGGNGAHLPLPDNLVRSLELARAAIQQENNLKYVISTRAKNSLHYINLPKEEKNDEDAVDSHCGMDAVEYDIDTEPKIRGEAR